VTEPAESPRRRPRIDDVFGDVLPEVTGDERATAQESRDDDTWYHDNRPPHHDRG
jgi:hypothetical protein